MQVNLNATQFKMQTHEKLAKLVLLLATTVPKVYYCYHFHINTKNKNQSSNLFISCLTMIGRKLIRLDLSRKLAFSTKWQKRAKEPNRFGILMRRGLAY